MIVLIAVVKVRLGLTRSRRLIFNAFIAKLEPLGDRGERNRVSDPWQVVPIHDGFYGRRGITFPFPQPIANTTSITNWSHQKIGRGTEKSYRFDQIRLARTVRSNNHIKGTKRHRRAVWSEGKEVLKRKFANEHSHRA